MSQETTLYEENEDLREGVSTLKAKIDSLKKENAALLSTSNVVINAPMEETEIIKSLQELIGNYQKEIYRLNMENRNMREELRTKLYGEGDFVTTPKFVHNALQGQLAIAREVLKDVEFKTRIQNELCCISCYRSKNEGHRPDCKLNAALGERKP